MDAAQVNPLSGSKLRTGPLGGQLIHFEEAVLCFEVVAVQALNA